MSTKTLNIILAVLIISAVVFGGSLLIKNIGSSDGVLQKTVSQKEGEKEIIGQSRNDLLRKEITGQLEEKQDQYEKLNNRIISAQKACSDVDLASVTKQQIKEVGRENFTQTVAGYYTCEAIKNKNVGWCNFLKDVDADLFRQCAMTAANIQIASERCSSESMNQCAKSGFFTQAECNSICSVYAKSDASACNIAADGDLKKACQAFAQNDITVCNAITDVLQKASCMNEFYFYSAIRDNSTDLLSKIGESFKQAIGKAIFDRNISCNNEFNIFIQEFDCASGLVADYDAIQKTIDTLNNEIIELTKRLNELQQ